MADGRFFIYAIALLVLSAVAALIAVRMLAARRSGRFDIYDDEEERSKTDIPLLFQPRAAVFVQAQPIEPAPIAPVVRPTPPTSPAVAPPHAAATVAPRVAPAPAEGPSVVAPSQPIPTARRAAEFTSPPASIDEGPMQLLPGRLEPLNKDAHQEIRFVKVAGVTRFTFGRSPGPAYQHVQLRAATASRMHGYMAFEAGRWRIGNLSETNRVLVNGSPLMEDAGRVLQDGDRIEFGEVAFVFRER